MLAGLHPDTLEELSGWERCRLALRDIILTAKRTRVLRREYGTEYDTLLDRVPTQARLISAYADIADQIDRYEPEFKLVRVAIVNFDGTGLTDIVIEGIYLPDGEPRRWEMKI